MTVVHKKTKSKLPDVSQSPFKANGQVSDLSASGAQIENIHLPDIP